MRFFRRTRPRPKQRQRTERSMLYRQVFVGICLCLCIGALVYATWYLTRLPAFTITTISVTGGETIPHTMLEQVAREELAGSYYRLIPKRFTYLYPREHLTERLLRISRMKTVTVELVDRHTLSISFTEHIPYALWCQEEADLQCFFIDATGYAFAPAPVLSGTAMVRYVMDDLVPSTGSNLVEEAVMRETNRFQSTLTELTGWQVTHILIDRTDITYRLSGGGELRTLRIDDPATILQNLTTVKSDDAFSNLSPDNFEYIDLRYGDKVFVKDMVEKELDEAVTGESENTGV